MKEALRPATDWELASMVQNFAARNQPVEVVGNGTKSNVGRPMQTAATVSTQSMRTITLYEPTELVMSAQTGTPLSLIEAELAARGQMLAFEPIDLGPATGGRVGQQTIGGVFASNLSGPRRVVTGAARDHLIGIKGVSGRAEMFKSGGRVMKNVTGYDLARGLSGSWGTLGILTEVTFKVLPWPEAAATLIYRGLTDDLAAELMCAAMGTPFEVSAAAHLSEGLTQRVEVGTLASIGSGLTAIRIENFVKSVLYRKDALRTLLKVYGEPIELDYESTLKFWSDLRRLSVVCDKESALWRISTSPVNGAKLVAAIRKHMTAEAYYDWSGGLIWLEVPATADAGASDIRRAVAVHGGHATLIRADRAIRGAVEVFQPQTPVLDRITRDIKTAFDPQGILNPGRMYAGI
ncbi:MAG: glycolate oxidase subunit GlcE [Hyphomicrobiaceae bacterium]|nr:glycolate oxidase subunit GlcE [Hyphomicrobiaceae bacterium]